MTPNSHGKLYSELSSDLLVEFARLLNQQNEFTEIIRLVAQQAATFLDAENSLLRMVNPHTRETVKTMFRGGAEVAGQEYDTVLDQVSGLMLKTGVPFLTRDIATDPRFQGDSFDHVDIRSVVGSLVKIEGVVLGTLILLNSRTQKQFTQADKVFLDKLAILASPYLRNTQKIQQFFERPLPESTLATKYEAAGLLGKSPEFLAMLHSMEAAARCDVRVMLEGKSGTGKELVARAIHQFSNRNDGPFVAIDCGAIPENLFESELFGYEKGAFTGAQRARTGLIEEANGGTFFMDEIVNLPAVMQAKLMRVLQEGEVRPLGSNQTRKVDVRIISASSRSLRDLVARKLFREDLFYRLLVYPIYIPELKERKGDVARLATHFLQKIVAEQGKEAEYFHANVLDFIKQRPWPGNIRELENLVERLVTLTPVDTNSIDQSLLPPDLHSEFETFLMAQERLLEIRPFPEQMREHEVEILRRALAANGWHQSKTAERLGMSEQNLRYRMKKLGIHKPGR